MRKLDGPRGKILKLDKRDDSLRYTVDVNRVSAVVKISYGAILAKEVSSVEFEAQPDTGIELICPKTVTYALQRTQIVSSVKIIYPALGGSLTVIPRTIVVLLCGGIACYSKRRITEALIASKLVDTAQQRCTQEVRIVYFASEGR
jgi:hypothetical protein